MMQEGEGSSGENGIKTCVSPEGLAEDRNKLPQIYSGSDYMVVAVCVILSMLFMKTGMLSFLFLVPLGYAVLVSGSIWITFLAAAAANIVLSLVLHLNVAHNVSLWMDIFYFTVILFMFNWIMGGTNLRTAYRLILASLAGAAAFIILIMNNSSDTSFYAVLNDMAELLASILANSSANGEAVQQAFTQERVLELIKSISLRGGAFISMLFIFFLNRQITLTAMWLIKRKRHEISFIQFFAPSYSIWMFSGALAAILLSSMVKSELLEILSWNVLTVSAVLFLAQGAGIIMHLFTRFTHVTRIIASVLAMFLLLSPVNTIAIAAVLILGIAETWLPIRIKKVES